MLVLLGLFGCEAQVYTPDGRPAQGGGATTSPSSGGASNAEGGGAPTPPGGFDANTACDEACNQPCVGDPLICWDACLAAIRPNCELESFASYECSMWYCDPSCDAAELESDLFGCVNPFYCGHGGNEYECANESGPSCDCVGQCDDGHTGQITCSADWICDCYFDGELVATCAEEATFSCDFQASCCISFFLPGGGPAGGN